MCNNLKTSVSIFPYITYQIYHIPDATLIIMTIRVIIVKIGRIIKVVQIHSDVLTLKLTFAIYKAMFRCCKGTVSRMLCVNKIGVCVTSWRSAY